MRILEEASLSTAVSKPSLVQPKYFIASTSPHLSQEGIAFAVAAKAMDMENHTFTLGRIRHGVSIGHQSYLLTVLLNTKFERIYLRPLNLNMLWYRVFGLS